MASEARKARKGLFSVVVGGKELVMMVLGGDGVADSLMMACVVRTICVVHYCG